ncbi:TonB-dependent receptor domain-containing protein [Chitinophaga sp. RAB17]|uniref:TonB-dependent receptor domain-containing protein n=1 Tax=Chitinophaga sp. RAB17 TaxID=3233049 RepID=UPI003F91FE21
MKASGFIISLLLLFTTASSYAQVNADTTITFKVAGACEQCKHRIETAVQGKGVINAVWDVDTKLLTLRYNTAKTSLDKIQHRILGVGHDLDHQQAKTDVYNELPACCHYREMEQMIHEARQDTLQTLSKDVTIKGVVMEEDRKGGFTPLPGASVVWQGTSRGTVTDATGVFHIKHDGNSSRLVVTYTGYRPDTITVTNKEELKIILASGIRLAEVKITDRQYSTYISSLNPIRTQVMTDKELFKAACCNLSESFETNPSVDVAYNDALTGSKQIQLLGLSGTYTQLTVENLPGPRGLATPLGLNAIAGPWIESIQLTKGMGSVANGYESIAGQINVELKKPENSEQLFANVYVNDFGKTDLNLNLSQKIGKKWSTGLLLHDDFINNKKLDANKDGFRDIPTGNQFSAINRWKYDDSKGFLAQFGVKALIDKRTGGQTDFNPSTDKYGTSYYGLGMNTERYEAFGKIGYVFPQKKYKSIGLQLSGISHSQDAYFGTTTYHAKQQNFYGNLIYQSIINNTTHQFRTGFSFLYDNYKEDFKLDIYKRTEIVPGAFFEYTYSPSGKIGIVAGIRGDHNNLFGFFVTPRLNVRYEPVTGTTIRLSAGRGQRTANIFAENTSVFVSARQVNIIGAAAGKAYGLNPEVAWNKGISVDQKFKLFQRDALLSVDFFRNDFSNQVVVDLENPRQVKFYNLDGKSYSNSLQAEVTMEPFKKLDVRLAYRYFDVKTTYSGQLMEKPFTSSHRAFANVAYAISGWKFDYTVNYNGRKRLPGTGENPVAYQRPSYSSDYVLMNAQITKTVGRKHPMDFYVGGENLSNFIQPDAIIAANQPFSPYFDASLVWGPVTGRMFYAGWRYKIK